MMFRLAINLTWDRPDRFYKPVRSNVGIFVWTKVGSPLLDWASHWFFWRLFAKPPSFSPRI